MKSRSLKIAAAVLAVAAIAFTYMAVRAQKKLVTLNVRDMDVREVVKKIERQVWEDIYVHKEVEGKVTMNVTDMPIEGALEIISEQTSARWTALYPLYTTRKSLDTLKKAIRGEVPASENGWKALQSNRIPGGMFGSFSRRENSLVTLNLLNKDVDIAAMAISRFSQAQVVPEDNTTNTVSLKLADATVPEAVEVLARKAERDWTKLYVLQGSRFGPGGPGGPRGPRGPEGERPREFARAENTGESPAQDGTNASPRDSDGPRRERSPEEMEEMRKRYEAQLETMTPEERQRAEEMRKRMEEMRNLTPDQRRERFKQMASSPEFQQRAQQRMLGGIKNTTPQQRVARDQRFMEMQKRGDH